MSELIAVAVVALVVGVCIGLFGGAWWDQHW